MVFPCVQRTSIRNSNTGFCIIRISVLVRSRLDRDQVDVGISELPDLFLDHRPLLKTRSRGPIGALFIFLLTFKNASVCSAFVRSYSKFPRTSCSGPPLPISSPWRVLYLPSCWLLCLLALRLRPLGSMSKSVFKPCRGRGAHIYEITGIQPKGGAWCMKEYSRGINWDCFMQKETQPFQTCFVSKFTLYCFCESQRYFSEFMECEVDERTHRLVLRNHLKLFLKKIGNIKE